MTVATPEARGACVPSAAGDAPDMDSWDSTYGVGQECERDRSEPITGRPSRQHRRGGRTVSGARWRSDLERVLVGRVNSREAGRNGGRTHSSPLLRLTSEAAARLRIANTPAAKMSATVRRKAHSGSVGTAATTTARSLVVLFVASQSPPPDTVALLVTAGTAPIPGFTVSVIRPGSVDVVVQVTTCPTAVHVHPVPAADTKVTFAGSVSVTVIGPTLVTPLLPSAIE